MSAPTLLAFDTATEQLSVAVCARGRVWSHAAAGGAQASAALIPAVLGVLAQAGVALRELDAIAFGRGPGAFTGLRTACSVAQGLAFGAGKPVLPIDTLLAIAEDARAGRSEPLREQHEPLRVWAVMDARMGELYAAQYAFADAHWSVLDAPMLTSPERLAAIWLAHAPQCVAGNALVAFGAALDAGTAQRVPEAWPSAVAMLPLARAIWAQGGAVDAAFALPLYLRDKVAQTTLEREAARAAKAALEASSR